MSDWDLRFIELSKLIASWSKDPTSKVGAVITLGNKITSVGYNGFPKGIEDNHRLDDRLLKNKMVVHAEINAAIHAEKIDLTGHTLYTYPYPPCHMCAPLLITYKISRIVSPNNIPEKWNESMNLALSLFQEAGIKVDLF